MTVAATVRKAGPYAGNGVTTSFPFSFKVFDAEGIQPVLTDSLGAASNLVLDSDYSVLLNADQDANPGGTVTYPILVGPTPMPAGDTLTIIGGMAYNQSTDITNNGRFLPQVFENAYDKLTILIQQLKEVSDRTLQAAVGTTVKLLFPAPSSGKFIRWRSDLLGLENVDAGTDSMTLQGLLADAASNTHGSYLVGYKPEPSTAAPRTVQSKLRETLSVKDFGAVGDATTDDTVAIQAAVDWAIANGKALYVPAGRYKTTAAINITNPLHVHGEDPQLPGVPLAAPTMGTWFYFAHNGKGFNVTSERGVSFYQIGTYRSTQVQPVAGVGAYVPTTQQPDFYLNTSNNPVLERLVLLNPFIGIEYKGIVTGQGGGGVKLRNIRMGALNIGVKTDDSYDSSIFSEIHIWPYWTGSGRYTNWGYTLANLIAFSFGRVDNPMMVNCFSIFANIGLHFFAGANGVVSRMFLTNVDIDRGQYGMRIDSGANGITGCFENCKFLGETTEIAGNGSGVLVDADNCLLRFGKLEVGNIGQYGVAISTGKTGNTISIDSLWIDGYALYAGSTANAVYMTGANTVNISGTPVITGAGGAAGAVYSANFDIMGWQTTSPARASATLYTNTKSRPILVEVSGQNGGVQANVSYTVDGVQRGALTLGANWYGSFTFAVPPRSTYRVDDFASILIWTER